MVVEVWPENWQAWQLFAYMQTQWRIGFGGRTGLDYTVLHHKMDRMNLDPEEYEQLENDIRMLEFAALEAMSQD
jgi:hypothetical protein